jgi:hypothetical protein
LPVAREVRRALKKTVSPDFILNLTETGRTMVFEGLTFEVFFFINKILALFEAVRKFRDFL